MNLYYFYHLSLLIKLKDDSICANYGESGALKMHFKLYFLKCDCILLFKWAVTILLDASTNILGTLTKCILTWIVFNYN